VAKYKLPAQNLCPTCTSEDCPDTQFIYSQCNGNSSVALQYQRQVPNLRMLDWRVSEVCTGRWQKREWGDERAVFFFLIESSPYNIIRRICRRNHFNVNIKSTLEQATKAQSSISSALDGVGGQRHAPAALPPGKTRYPLYRRLSGPQGQSGRVRKISPPPGFDPRTVQPVASRYIDWAIPGRSRNHLNILNSICIYCWG
jgi:hypothetical protein